MEQLALPTELRIPHGRTAAGQPTHLLCRLPTLDDVPALVEACQDPEIPQWTTVPSPYGEEHGRGYVEFSAAKWGTRAGLHLLITPGQGHPLADIPLLGSVGTDIDWAGDEAEVGYWIHARARRHGVAATATAGLCRWLLDAGLQRLQAKVLVGNVGSVRTLEKVGFKLEGTLRGVAAGPCGIGAERIDEHILGLLPHELAAVEV